MKKRYRYWTRLQFYDHLKLQALEFSIPIEIVQEAVFNSAWNPMLDFNGCNFVQDDFHPYLPCFIHDYRWVVYGRTDQWDKEFRNNLLKLGFSTFKATIYYFAVRIGSVYYNLTK